MADIELATDLLEKLKVSMNKDHGDEPVDSSKSRTWNQTDLLDELQTFLRISNDKHRVMETRTKRLATEIRILHQKLEEERNKNKLLTEKMAQTASKEMDFFFKEKKVKFLDSEENKEKASPPPENNEIIPDPQIKVDTASAEGDASTTVSTATAKQPEAEPCVYITRSELCRLEGDMAALLEVLRKREQTWERTKERERNARQKCITLAATAAKFSDMATHQRSEIETKMKQIEKMAIELSKYKGECLRLRRFITQVRKDTSIMQDSANDRGAASSPKQRKTLALLNKSKTASKKHSKAPAEKSNERSGP